MVRLKVIDLKATGQIGNISIPYGAIKSGVGKTSILDALCISIPYGAIKRYIL